MTDAPSRLDRATLIPIGAALSAAVVVASAYGYLESRFSAVTSAMHQLDRRLEKLEERSADRWTLVDQALWAARLRTENPALQVPEVRTP